MKKPDFFIVGASFFWTCVNKTASTGDKSCTIGDKSASTGDKSCTTGDKSALTGDKFVQP
ncbi:hypothetical protein [Bacillus sp. ISL-55]|uniref:hypothetical protein n=1 Tax=Bacillus sp. ISL-55 TaxID=2819134 RepID=UPI001BE7B186|nr:hypothetical protein [Bacillus sp. ISL-55]MBT2693969.1 hypothetical protein [Bacillus sp. ISL-55]